jgi:hypothetical protein
MMDGGTRSQQWTSAGVSADILAAVEEGAPVTPAGAGWHPRRGQGGG